MTAPVGKFVAIDGTDKILAPPENRPEQNIPHRLKIAIVKKALLW